MTILIVKRDPRGSDKTLGLRCQRMVSGRYPGDTRGEVPWRVRAEGEGKVPRKHRGGFYKQGNF